MIPILVEEPMKEFTIEDAKVSYANIKDENDIAVLYAVAENKFWWQEDNTYDYERGTEEHRIACDKCGAWLEIKEKLEEDIFTILRSEGVEIPEKGQIVVLEPFMRRNGYWNAGGWWVKAVG